MFVLLCFLSAIRAQRWETAFCRFSRAVRALSVRTVYLRHATRWPEYRVGMFAIFPGARPMPCRLIAWWLVLFAAKYAKRLARRGCSLLFIPLRVLFIAFMFRSSSPSSSSSPSPSPSSILSFSLFLPSFLPSFVPSFLTYLLTLSPYFL